MVVLAGGEGTRVAHLLPGIPKPMAPVNGRPFLDWLVRHFQRYGLKTFRISTGYLGAVIENYVERTDFGGAQITCVREPGRCGTAGGFLYAVQGCAVPRGGYLVANGDSMLVIDPGLLIAAATRNAWHAALFGLEVAEARRYGSLEVDDSGCLKGFREKEERRGIVNAGVYFFRPDVVGWFPRQRPLSFEYEVFPALLAAGARVGVVSVDVSFIDIGTPSSLGEVGAFVFAHLQSLA